MPWKMSWGVKLFLRTSKSVRLTQEGYQFLQYAGEILKLTQLSKARMKESCQAAPLRLVIGCRNAAELRFLRPALERLRQERPEVLPVLRLIPFDSVENLLAEGDVHLIFSFRESTCPRRGTGSWCGVRWYVCAAIPIRWRCVPRSARKICSRPDGLPPVVPRPIRRRCLRYRVR